MYLGYVISGGELKIDSMNMEAIIEWPTPTHVLEVRIFVSIEQSLQKFIASFSIVIATFHTIIAIRKSL